MCIYIYKLSILYVYNLMLQTQNRIQRRCRSRVSYVGFALFFQKAFSSPSHPGAMSEITPIAQQNHHTLITQFMSELSATCTFTQKTSLDKLQCTVIRVWFCCTAAGCCTAKLAWFQLEVKVTPVLGNGIHRLFNEWAKRLQPSHFCLRETLKHILCLQLTLYHGTLPRESSLTYVPTDSMHQCFFQADWRWNLSLVQSSTSGCK